MNAPACYTFGYTVLQAAAEQGSLRISKLLIKARAGVDEPGSKRGGFTAIQAAAKKGRIDMLKLLLGNCPASGVERGRQLYSSMMCRAKGHFDFCVHCGEFLRARVISSSWQACGPEAPMNTDCPNFTMDSESQTHVILCDECNAEQSRGEKNKQPNINNEIKENEMIIGKQYGALRVMIFVPEPITS
ncbi:hypothetical protein BX600DRAFT_513877 [Xylariales sp. PMI_506]|nr:hypothetical protein BX600DRAFT_513877 [Xylariales sp. PMI_506]